MGGQGALTPARLLLFYDSGGSDGLFGTSHIPDKRLSDSGSTLR